MANPEFFRNFESKHLPDISWEEMMEKQIVFSPRVMHAVLKDAREFLMTEPGPHLEIRKQIAPPWFEYWMTRIFPTANLITKDYEVSYKLVPFDNVKRHLRQFFPSWDSGVLFVAAAEGHAGHLRAEAHMAKWTEVPVWAFEQDSYLETKPRGAPFLSLPFRLSLWHYSKLKVLTVSPERVDAVRESIHYKYLFDRLGVTRCFADEIDPYVEEKTHRGEFRQSNVIPHKFTPSTHDRVERILADAMDDLGSSLATTFESPLDLSPLEMAELALYDQSWHLPTYSNFFSL